MSLEYFVALEKRTDGKFLNARDQKYLGRVAHPNDAPFAALGWGF
jgi:hypothetical protein